jgi:hypothetical protein
MKWEYQTVKLNVVDGWNFSGVEFDTDKVQDFTNQLGAQGWELVSAFSVNAGAGYSKEIVFIFKRPTGE